MMMITNGDSAHDNTLGDCWWENQWMGIEAPYLRQRPLSNVVLGNGSTIRRCVQINYEIFCLSSMIKLHTIAFDFDLCGIH